MKLDGKVALITGAARGIGYGIAKRFIEAGGRVAIADLDEATSIKSAAELAGADRAMGLKMDVTNEAEVTKGVDSVAAKFGQLDILISNAGIQIVHPIEQLPFEDWKKLLSIHLDGAFLTTKAALPHMYKRKTGTVIYMGSVHSKEASPLKSAYVTAKHGLLGLSRVLAKEGAQYGVRSAVICPGFVRTPLVEKQIPEQAAALKISEKEVVERIMLGDTVDKQFTTVEDVAEVALLFAAFETNALTGQSLNVSHGWSMT